MCRPAALGVLLVFSAAAALTACSVPEGDAISDAGETELEPQKVDTAAMPRRDVSGASMPDAAVIPSSSDGPSSMPTDAPALECEPGSGPRCQGPEGKGRTVETCDNGKLVSGATCAYRCSAGKCTGECMADDKRCGDKGAPQVCSAESTWTDRPACAQGICEKGECVASCSANAKDCMGNVPQTCTGGKWVPGTACTTLCKGGVCTACKPNDVRCKDATIETCDANGEWKAGATCTTACIAGACTACKPSSSGCIDGVPATCAANGTWTKAMACATGICVNGACQGNCKPGVDQPTCENGAPKTCEANGQWKVSAACSIGTCSQGKCMCSPKPEVCFNGADEDCDGMIDCADADCMPVAVCVPSAAGFKHGARVAADANCPAAFSGAAQTLYEGLSEGAGCQGCSCTPRKTECEISAYYYDYDDSPRCLNDTGLTGGNKVAVADTQLECRRFPILATEDSWTGIRFSVKAKPGCNVGGSASPTQAKWSGGMKLCGVPSVGGGCAGGNVCVPRAQKDNCMVAPDTAFCPAGFSKAGDKWYTGLSDNRTCSCSCSASGGKCFVEAQVGTWDESTGQGTCGQKVEIGAASCSITYAPAYSIWHSDQQDGTCAPAYQKNGAAAPTGLHTVCCAN